MQNLDATTTMHPMLGTLGDETDNMKGNEQDIAHIYPAVLDQIACMGHNLCRRHPPSILTVLDTSPH